MHQTVSPTLMDHIRNFSIIAHIDHGKSTLADRLIQRCGGLSDREMEAQVLDAIGIDATDAIPCSAKTGMGIDEILEAVIARMPPPQGRPDGPPRAMIIDSWFDNYVGVVMLVRVVDGVLRKNERIRMMASNAV